MRQASQPQEIWIQWHGAEFQVFVGEDGHYYLHDPNGLIEGLDHVALPTTHITGRAQLNGLGASEAGKIAGQVIPAALSFVPVVGPILGPLASVIGGLIGGMFGGNDPTPIGALDQKVLSLRQGILAANQAMGVADQMPTLPRSYAHPYPSLACVLELWPSNANIQDNNHWTCDWAGVNCAGCGNMRKCLYAAINKLTPIYQAKTQAASTASLKASIIQSITGGSVAPTAAPAGNVSPTGVPVYNPTSSPGGAVNYGSPYDPNAGLDTTQLPGGIAPAPSPTVSSADILGGLPSWSLPLLLIGIPLTIALVAGDKPPKQQIRYRERRHATERR